MAAEAGIADGCRRVRPLKTPNRVSCLPSRVEGVAGRGSRCASKINARPALVLASVVRSAARAIAASLCRASAIVAMKEAMGMVGLFIIHPRTAYEPVVDQDCA